MNALSFGAFFCALLGVFMAIAVLRLDRSAPLNQAMAVLGFGYAVFCFCHIWLYGSSDKTAIWFFAHLGIVMLLAFIFPSALLADLIFAGISIKRRVLILSLFCVFMAFLLVYSFVPNAIYTDFVTGPWGNVEVIGPDHTWITLSLVAVLFQQILSWILLLRRRSKVKSLRIKRIILVLVCGTMFISVENTFQEALVRSVHLPNLDIFQALLSIGLLFFLVVRYGYLGSEVATMEQEILHAVKEAVIVVGPDLKIRKANPATEFIFQTGGRELISEDFAALFDQPDQVRTEWQKAAAARKTGEIVGLSVKANDVELSLAPSLDSFGDLTGGIATVRQNEAFASVFSRYGITARERDVVFMLLRGHNRQEIAESKFIAPSTVKNHIHNIYEKTGAANRVELLLMLLDRK